MDLIIIHETTKDSTTIKNAEFIPREGENVLLTIAEDKKYAFVGNNVVYDFKKGEVTISVDGGLSL